MLLSGLLLAWAALSLKFLPVPFVWIGGGTALLTGLAFFFVPSRLRPLLFNLAIVAVFFAAAELYCQHILSWEETRYEGSYTQGFYDTRDPVVGWRPLPSQRKTIRKFVDNVLVYDTVYTIDKNDLRTTPQIGDHDSFPVSTVLFFGCSFTFGEGVADEKTMPALVAASSKEPIQVFNFGVPGYGPHQMLAALQQGMVDEIVGDTMPQFVIYQAITGHVRRVAAMGWAVNHGPRYVLDQQGVLVQQGYFDDHVQTLHEKFFFRQMAKSYIYRFLVLEYRERRPTAGGDLDLFTAVVGVARDEVEHRYPGCRFQMVFWDDPIDDLTSSIIDRMEVMGITLHRVSEILPDWKNKPEKYWLHPRDPHPNAWANALIARYLRQIVVTPEGAVRVPVLLDGGDGEGR